MKLSISLSDEDVRFVDEYARRAGIAGRSTVVHKAVELLRLQDLERAYADAWDEWDGSEDAALWENTSGDGIVDATR
ncbi:Arc/MetJ-type ribon-helix-helix transcriptional regulator [Catenuloplanes nepalensis]|uniref:Arc/MetJ-type ribon-helix-helix transcriptional regulator n=1 Tax=Catenuloplanes nepalensis TaxID=587533 RepID=A0ABT9MZV3_9ACTN|nr:antitoxin [Catenuloplanes nepalensis]MDP9796976.1 Arc/MetJ-type ribon-helix-helix transcriptional regulator [Catenuloplanes nepalensis]